MERRNQAVQWPGAVTSDWVVSLCATLEAASHEPAKRLPRFLPSAVLLKLLSAAIEALSADETLVTLQPPHGTRVVVVGDTHGQLHDVLRMFELAGWPSPEQLFVLNGDYVDRRARHPAWRGCARLAPAAPLRRMVASGLRPACALRGAPRARASATVPVRAALSHALCGAGARGAWRRWL